MPSRQRSLHAWDAEECVGLPALNEMRVVVVRPTHPQPKPLDILATAGCVATAPPSSRSLRRGQELPSGRRGRRCGARRRLQQQVVARVTHAADGVVQSRHRHEMVRALVAEQEAAIAAVAGENGVGETPPWRGRHAGCAATSHVLFAAEERELLLAPSAGIRTVVRRPIRECGRHTRPQRSWGLQPHHVSDHSLAHTPNPRCSCKATTTTATHALTQRDPHRPVDWCSTHRVIGVATTIDRLRRHPRACGWQSAVHRWRPGPRSRCHATTRVRLCHTQGRQPHGFSHSHTATATATESQPQPHSHNHSHTATATES